MKIEVDVSETEIAPVFGKALHEALGEDGSLSIIFSGDEPYLFFMTS